VQVRVRLVYTERRADLTDARARNYERLRAGLAAAGAEVSWCWYEDVDVAGADAVVLSGSSAPWSSHDVARLDGLGEAIGGLPVLGVCAGLQLLARFAGGRVGPAAVPERGLLPVDVHDHGDLLHGLQDRIVVYQDHTDEVTELPDGFRVLASSADCAVQAIADPARRWWATQFHPEESPDGDRIFRSFLELARA
jgi:GMP synthase (glutamine-hydrolysing)